ncbi:MAG TPA: winged helix-turn-helix domain-containing protein [Solirubrobacterales bacterium]|jgi:DNA-binding transcriptional ArsR family regulator|nr:winged helix-turn-helix domain-containing protein [Solirubrobacterales bacterium]
MNPGKKSSKAGQHAYEARMVRSTVHPIRAKALSMMAERPTSPKEIAAAVGKPIGNVAYHIKELKKAGMVMLVEEKKRGGATEHFYLATTIDDEASRRIHPDQREILARTGLHLIVADAARALEAGMLSSRPDVQMARIPLHVDERGWCEIRDLYVATLNAALAAAAQSAKRLEEGDGDGFRALAVAMLFEMASEPERDS